MKRVDTLWYLIRPSSIYYVITLTAKVRETQVMLFNKEPYLVYSFFITIFSSYEKETKNPKQPSIFIDFIGLNSINKLVCIQSMDSHTHTAFREHARRRNH